MGGQKSNCVSIMQPGYLPWPGFFDLVFKADIFVLYDSVKYDKNSWRNRNRVRVYSSKGWSWLTVPVESSANSKPLRDVKISRDINWQQKHMNIIRENYRGCEYFEEYFAFFDDIFNKDWHYLIDVTNCSIEIILQILGKQDTKFVYSSDMALTKQEGKTEKLLEICQRCNANVLYLSNGSKAYFNMDIFDQARIQVAYQKYAPPIYSQAFPPFVHSLSTLDLVLNCGPQSLDVLLGNEDSLH